MVCDAAAVRFNGSSFNKRFSPLHCVIGTQRPHICQKIEPNLISHVMTPLKKLYLLILLVSRFLVSLITKCRPCDVRREGFCTSKCSKFKRRSWSSIS